MPESETRDRDARARGIPSAGKLPRWFDPRARDAGSWAFILNRLTGLGLTFYLGLHLIVLNRLAQGPRAYDDFVALSQSSLIKLGEVVLIAAVLFHGLNGLRLTLHAFGIGIRHQKKLLSVALLGTLFTSILFAVRLFVE
ncbi:MAG TPA: succinate dehydrogenase, cytochrome b556 subunit [Anaerolineales bacterium]